MTVDTRPTGDIVSDLRLAQRMHLGGEALKQYLTDAISRLEDQNAELSALRERCRVAEEDADRLAGQVHHEAYCYSFSVQGDRRCSCPRGNVLEVHQTAVEQRTP